MAAEITDITERNQLTQAERDGLLLAVNDRLTRIEDKLASLGAAFSAGGAKAARRVLESWH